MRAVRAVRVWLGAVAFAVCAMSSQAFASTILISDVAEGPPVVTGPVTGLICSVSVFEQCSFTIPAPAGATALFIDFVQVNMFEPGSNAVSDQLSEDDPVLASFWFFQSDVDGGQPLLPFIGGPNTNNLTENGSPQTAVTITYRDVTGAFIGTDVIQIQSDVPVPEPSSGVLALLGLGAVGVVRWRTRAGA